jgi:hypothetical protein
MTFSTRDLQARCAALGFWPGPIDGKMGKRTAAAIEAATAFQAKRGKPLIHASGISRVHWHWTVGWNKANDTDKEHYHAVFEGDGTEVLCHEWDDLLAHTRNANSGAVGLSLCGMVKALERPFSAGPEPITAAALASMAKRTANLCVAFDIPVSRWSTLSHSEIQPTLAIPQRQKWDINFLPGMTGPTDPITAGDRIRAMVTKELRGLAK